MAAESAKPETGLIEQFSIMLNQKFAPHESDIPVWTLNPPKNERTFSHDYPNSNNGSTRDCFAEA